MKSDLLKRMYSKFKISNEEYRILEKQFGNLCYFAAQQLYRKNKKNNQTDEIEDIAQELRLALLDTGVYCKRQIYIERCLEVAHKYCDKDYFLKKIVDKLQELWDNRKVKGIKKRFGQHQENLLDFIIKRCVPEEERPDPNAKLVVDIKFIKYCKQIVWNRQRNLGKRITRELPLRNGICSLSSFDYLGGEIDL